MKRGDIYYIQHRNTTGAEIQSGRPAIIVSNEALNATSTVLEVVFLTTQPKKELPTHVTIRSTGVESTALCEQVNSVSLSLVGKYCGTCTIGEMKAIDAALLVSLGITEVKETDDREAHRVSDGERRLMGELGKIQAERDRYAKMVDFFLAGKEDSDEHTKTKRTALRLLWQARV